jgi:hypothetical protein
MFPPNTNRYGSPRGFSFLNIRKKFIWYSIRYIAKHFVVHFETDSVAKTLVVPMLMGVIFKKR